MNIKEKAHTLNDGENPEVGRSHFAPSVKVLPDGNWPVLLTPFTEEMEIDWEGYDRLMDFYLERGAAGLFAVCHSSEMDFLNENEILGLAKAAVERASGSVGVVASLGKCNSYREYVERAEKIADTGVDAVVLTCSTMLSEFEDDRVLVDRVIDIAEKLSVAVGLYEAPIPYHRLLSNEAFEAISKSGKVIFYKDTCCNLDRLKQRIDLSQGSRLKIYNAHMPSFLDSLNAGVAGYCGIGSNFFPELYSYLCDYHQALPENANAIHQFILKEEPELVGVGTYPVSAKAFLAVRGVPIQCKSRKSCSMPELKDISYFEGSLKRLHALTLSYAK